ncbi:lipid A 3-O-deacylase [Rhodanobacter sp. OR444]|uniref:lipid A 3-O-deacylase n=1 Tax=Rhodanobacter sp. OR444 TaxID=1076525 RepID=UPI0016395E4D|nr:lipid A 3-O-deacylase [Rhodanobacter sp. OR444]
MNRAIPGHLRHFGRTVLAPAASRLIQLATGRPRWQKVALAIVLGWINAIPAQAADITVEAGPSWTKGQRSTAAAFVTALGKERSFGRLQWQPEFDLGMVKSRHVALKNLDRTVWVAAAGARIPHMWKHLFFSFQVAAATPHTGALSSTPQFVSSLGWQQGRVVVMLRHISNGSTHEPNYGESMLLLGMRF